MSGACFKSNLVESRSVKVGGLYAVSLLDDALQLTAVNGPESVPYTDLKCVL